MLSKALEGDYGVIVACVDSAMEFTVSPSGFTAMNFSLCAGQEISPDEAVKKLIYNGYVRCDTVEGPGQFAKRGGILDIFTPDKTFRPAWNFGETKLTAWAALTSFPSAVGTSFDKIEIPPAREVLINDPEGLTKRLEDAVSRLRSPKSEKTKEQILSDAELLKTTGSTGGLDRFIPFIEGCGSTVFDYTADALLFVSDTAKVKEKARVFHWQLSEDIKSLFGGRALCKRA